MAMKIAVYSIAKSEHAHVRRFMDSCDGADIVVVGVETGDTTGDMLEALGAKVVRIDIEPFRFDSYRNAVLNCVPDDVDVCISLDLDETLPNDWRSIIEKDWKPRTTKLRYWLQWSEDHKFYYDRIHSRHGYVWRHANHEAVYAIDKRNEFVSTSSLTIKHSQDTSKDRSKNLRLLELAVSENPDDVRMNWYLGREYFMLERYDDAINLFKKYILLEPKWKIEKSWACIFIGNSYDYLLDRITAEAWLHSAIANCYDSRDPYFELAKHYATDEKWDLVLFEINNALKIESDKHGFIHSNGSYGWQIHYLRGEAYYYIGDKESSKKSFMKARLIGSIDAQKWLDIL